MEKLVALSRLPVGNSRAANVEDTIEKLIALGTEPSSTPYSAADLDYKLPTVKGEPKNYSYTIN